MLQPDESAVQADEGPIDPVASDRPGLALGMADLGWARRGTPMLSYALGLSGAIPVVALSTALVAIPSGVAVPELTMALLAYGATVLSFIGAVHWGIALATARVSAAARRWARWRLALGVLPSLIAWAALLVGVFVKPDAGLPVLILGLAVTAGVESLAARRHALPPGYMAMRWLLTVVVIACLLAAALARMA